MLANKLNYGDTIGVVGVSNSLEKENKYELFYKAEKFFQSKGFKVKRGKYVLENYKRRKFKRRFAHLKQYVVFDKIKGIIVGYNYDLQKNGPAFPQMEDILLEYTKEYNFPIIKCNDFGHKMVNGVIPIGVNATISASDGKIEIIDEFLFD